MRKTTRTTKQSAAPAAIANIVENTTIADFIENDNLEYMFYTITDRAVPSVIDGMKPGARRMLYSMLKDGVTPDAKPKKSARLVNSAVGQFHPHGGAAMYGMMASTLAANYSRVKLVDGIGDFGGAPGNPPAQDRYTEARLSKHGFELVRELADRAVPFQPTYDDESEEPVFLSPTFPVLLINGVEGLSEGYRSAVPEHNPHKVMELCIRMIDEPDISDEDIFDILEGPDWGTGGEVIGGRSEVLKYISTGRANLTVRGKLDVDNKAKTVTITEVPPGVAVPKVYDELRDGARNGTIEGVRDVELLSDMKHPIRIVVSGKRGTDMEKLRRDILLTTKLETTYTVLMIALDRNRTPRLWTIREQVEEFLKLREEVLINKTTTQAAKLNKELLKQTALAKVLLDKEKAVKVVMAAKDEKTAAHDLAAAFDITPEQGEIVAALPLRRLSKASVLDAEKKVTKTTKELAAKQKILDSKARRRTVLRKELEETAKLFDDPHYDRKTRLLYDEKPTKKDKKDSAAQLSLWKLDPDMGILSDVGNPIPEGDVVYTAFTGGKIKLFAGGGLPQRITPKTVAPDTSTMIACGTLTPGGQDLLLVSSGGKVLRTTTDPDKFKPQGIAGTGVAGMKLSNDETLVACLPVNGDEEILTLSTDGWKVTKVSDIPAKGRGGGGVMVHNPKAAADVVVEAHVSPTGFQVEGKKANPFKRSAATRKGHPTQWAAVEPEEPTGE